ncbi:MAG: helix-turn-helix transcriptional regulator [Bacteroidales bacterium]|nr:helix-turn-helix transcriptional regulator [Bacteroidales bacterium]
MDNDTIKKNITDLRAKFNLSQTEVAARMGISRTAYRNLENGSTHLVSDSLEKLAMAFDMTPEEILLGYRPWEGGSRRLNDVRQEYLDKKSLREQELEKNLAEVKAQNETLQGYVEALKEVIRTKDEIIAMLKSYGK